MAANGSTSDPLLDQIFSGIQLPPTSVTHQPAEINSEYRFNQSDDDEQNAIRQLDDILQQNFDGSYLESEPSEDELPSDYEIENDSSTTLKSSRSSRTNSEVHKSPEFHSSATLKSPKSSRTNSEVHKSPEFRPSEHVESYEENDIDWKNETYDSFDSAAPPESRSFDRAVHGRQRSQTYDSSDEINLHHNEVAYLRPSIEEKPTKQYTSTPKIEPQIDNRKLSEYQQKLIESRKKEQQLHDEINKVQSIVLNKEFVVRQATQNVKKHLVELQKQKKSKHKNDYRSISLDSTVPHQSKLPQQQSFNEGKQAPVPVDIYEEDVPVSSVLSNQMQNAELVEICSEFRYFTPIYKHIKLSKGIEKFIIGGDQNPTEDDKAVLLFGPAGSGKTALVNSMINFLYEVNKEHDVRFCINHSDNNEPTKGINVYVFNNTIYPYSITIIDTPGIPNKKGYTGTSTLIKNWFDLELKTSGSLRIDAVSVVLKHDEGELQWPLVNELAAVKRLLKDDLRTNVMPVTTHGEVLPQPSALRSLVYANIPFISYYKINNAGYMQLNPGEKILQHNLCYKHTVYELERYFTDLHELVTPLLAVTHRVQ